MIVDMVGWMAEPKLRQRYSRNNKIWEWKNAKRFQKTDRSRNSGRQALYVLEHSGKVEPWTEQLFTRDW